MPYHSNNQLQRSAAGRVAAWKNLQKAPEQKLDDQSVQHGRLWDWYMKQESELSDGPEATIQHIYADCIKKCQKIPVPFLLPKCELGCLIANPYGSQPNSQVSEKLATTANNLSVDSEQLLAIADSLELMGI